MKATAVPSDDFAVSAPAVIKGVIIYEDATAGKRGERFFQNLRAAIGMDYPSTHNLWSFPALTIPEIRNIAASTAAAADVVIFALSGEKELPAKVKEWIEMWLWLIDGGHPALVPLLDRANAKSAAICAYLRSVTGSKHLDCFPLGASFAAVFPAATLPNRADLAQRTVSSLRIVRGQQFAVPRFRRNE